MAARPTVGRDREKEMASVDLSRISDADLVFELKGRGYSVLHFNFTGLMAEATAKKIRKNRTPLDEPLADKYALDLWVAAVQGDTHE